MKQSLAHLPQDKRDMLRRITALIRELVSVEMLILFGSYARGDWIEDFGPAYMSDVDILVLVTSNGADPDDECWFECRERAWDLCQPIHVDIVVHTLEDMYHMVEQGNSFFREALTEGIALYDSGRVELPAITELTLAQRLALARVAFPGYFTMAGEFYEAFRVARTAARNGDSIADMVWRCIALFDLHQTAEYVYKAVSLAFQGYLPKTNHLQELDWMRARAVPELESVIPVGAANRKRLTRLMTYGYVARRIPNFVVTLDELDVIAEHVCAFRQRAKQACRARLAALAEELGQENAR